MTRRKAGTRTHLALKACGKRDGDAGRNKRARSGRKLDRRIGRHGGKKIEAGGERTLVFR